MQNLLCLCMYLTNIVQMLSECVAESEVGQSESLPLLQQLLHCVTAITIAAAHTCHLHSAALFSVLLRISASRHYSVTLKSQVACFTHILYMLLQLYFLSQRGCVF